MNPDEAFDLIRSLTPRVNDKINDFSANVLRTRGGRFGSGMGSLLEALWCYYMNGELSGPQDSVHQAPVEIAWIPEHEYNDFACVLRDQIWDPTTRTGELLRIEAKSMNTEVDEAKGHFDELTDRLGEHDLLLVLLWTWRRIDQFRSYPYISDHFIGQALSIAALRDSLHVARGGSFVDRTSCPELCESNTCNHHGEPINASGKRERLSGPTSRRPSGVSYAANFGGLVRMLKTNSPGARHTFRDQRATNDVAHEYITFIHRNFAEEERNQYLRRDWEELADKLSITTGELTKDELIRIIRRESADYREELRFLNQ